MGLLGPATLQPCESMMGVLTERNLDLPEVLIHISSRKLDSD